jgi:hypothetical protein
MAAGEGNEVLVGFLDHAEPLAQMRHRPFLEGDHRRHRREDKPEAVNFLQRDHQRIGAKEKRRRLSAPPLP